MTITATVEGREYYGELMRVNALEIGPWGDEMLRINVAFEAEATGQGTGVYMLRGEALARWLRGLMHVANVDDLRGVTGSLLVVLRRAEFGFIHGVMNPTDEGRYFMFREDEA